MREDWGWWVELVFGQIRSGACIYAMPDAKDPIEYVCTDGFKSERKWNWSSFRFVDTKPLASKLYYDLTEIFQKDQEIQIVGISDDFPF